MTEPKYPPRPPRGLLPVPPDARREPSAPEDSPSDWREIAIALAKANSALSHSIPLFEERLQNCEAGLRTLQTRAEGPRSQFISQHDVEEMVQTATKSDRVRGVIARYGFEAGGRVLLWALGIAGAVIVAAVAGYGIHDCAQRSPAAVAPAHS